MKSAVVFGMIGVGVLLLFMSGVWSSLKPGTSSWTNEKDQQLSQASDKMHLLTAKIASAESHPSMHGGPDLPKAKAELAVLVEENKTLMNEFKGIQARPHTMSKFMKWSGISLTLVGLAGWYAVSQSR
jgi:hypothetical protein